MTIFNSIKYPISFPPTEQELAALPHRLFRRWASKVSFGSRVTAHDVAVWYSFLKNTHGPIIEEHTEVDLLRKMISGLRT